VVGLIIVASFIALALFAPWIAPHDHLATNWGRSARRRTLRIGSVPTKSAVTCWRV